MSAIGSPVILADFALIIVIVLALIIGRPKTRGWYLVSLFVISLNLLFITQLITPHLIGTDVHREKYIIDQAIALEKWNPSNPVTNLNTLLSITVFPTMVHQILNISSESFLKYITPLIYAFVPLILFLIYERIFRELGKIKQGLSENRLVLSFLASLVYIFNFYFLMGPSNSRMIPASLGMSLAVYAMVNRDMPDLVRRLIFILSSLLVFFSHYTSSAIWIITAFGAVVILIPSAKYIGRKMAVPFTANTAMLLFILYIFWYFFVTYAFSESMIKIPQNILNNLSLLFNPTVYSPELLETVTGRGLEPGLPTLIMKIVGNTIRVVIPVGFLAMLFWTLKKRANISWELLVYFMLSVFSFIIISLSFLPRLTFYYDIQRIYLHSLILLSIFFPAGIYFIVDRLTWLSRKTLTSNKLVPNVAIWLAFLVLITQFLCQNGTIFHLAGDNRLIYYADPVEHDHIMLDQEVTTVRWVAGHRDKTPVAISGYRGLIGYGQLWEGEVSPPGSGYHGLLSIGRFYPPDELTKFAQHDMLYDAGLTRVYRLH